METLAGAQGRVATLLWSLDDALRYLPMAALYDGRHYLVERFNNVLFTPASYGHMADRPLLAEPSQVCWRWAYPRAMAVCRRCPA